jgi:hypothetical protein
MSWEPPEETFIFKKRTHLSKLLTYRGHALFGIFGKATNRFQAG